MHRTPELSDEDCMTQLSTGKLDAAALLFQRYQRSLFNFFLRQGISAEASEDLVQNLFERVIKYRQTYRQGMPFRAWLYQIARNVQADWQRQGKRLPQQELDAGAMELPEHNPSFEQEEDLHRMEKAMQKLAPEQLEILLLARYQRMKYAEVAELLGCSEGAVKLKVFRALQQLRSLYFKLEQL
jgi:RNA polymerase sigma-70 factor (ECF subfamily)